VGEGEVWFEGERRSSAEVLQALGWKPIRLHAKEGLALLNGTQFSLSYGLASYTKAAQLLEWADLIAALSIEAFACKHSPFDERLHLIRPQAGQVATAANLRYWLQGSEIAQALPAMSVQDPYAFRCVPQVHGASRDALGYVANVLCTEANSVTDNPNVFYETQAILSGGNFHAQPLALALDFMAIALAELGSISERRLYQLIGGKRELPPFLTQHSGLHSGLMIAQYTAASIVSQNKQLCTPASVDSIVSCNGQEDHVSMAANAGTKLYRVVQNLERLLAIELLAACQAISLRGLALAPRLRACYAAFRKEIPFLEADRFLSKDLHRAIDFLREQSHFLAK
jgi:histidine ammonia-lyase